MFVHNINHKISVISSDLDKPLKSSHSISDLQTLSEKESNGELYGILSSINNRKGPSDLNLSTNNEGIRNQRYGHSKRFDNQDFGYGKLDLSSSGISSSSSGVARHLTRSELDCVHCDDELNVDLDCKNDSDLIRIKNRNRNALLKRMADARAGKKASSQSQIEFNGAIKVFDMSKFKAILERESRRTNPNRVLLQNLCISIVSFVLDDNKILNLPSWVMIINIVAIDLLRAQIGLTDPYGLQLPPALSCLSADRCDLMAYSALGDRSAALPVRKMPMRRYAPLTASKKAFAEAAASGVFDDDDYYDTSMYAQAKVSYKSQEGVSVRHGTCKDDTDDGYSKDLKGKLLNAASGGGFTDGHCRAEAAQSSSSSGFNSNSFLQNTDSSAASSSSNITFSSSDCDAGRASSDRSDTNNKKNRSDTSEFIGVEDSKEDHRGRDKVENKFKSANFKSAADDKKELNQKRIASNVCLAATKALLFKKQQSKINADESRIMAQSLNAISERPSTPRGKRLPKSLDDSCSNMDTRDHSCQELVNGNPCRPIVSRPIPIPAPPTCLGDAPSGKANLILVSPTGLSPPMPRRTDLSLEAVGTRQGDDVDDRNDAQASFRQTEFGLIKHIDESGHCSVLVGDSAAQHKINISCHHRQYMGQCGKPPVDVKHAKSRMALQQPLPTGIPAHAQLAPPATQRHILRYLMSATQHKLVDMIKQRKSGDTRKQSHLGLARNDDIISAPVMRYQRPLPILPGQKRPAPLPLSATRHFGVLRHPRINHNPSHHSSQFQDQQQQQPGPQEDILYYCGLQARIPSRRVWASTRSAEPLFSRNLYYY